MAISALCFSLSKTFKSHNKLQQPTVIHRPYILYEGNKGINSCPQENLIHALCLLNVETEILKRLVGIILSTSIHTLNQRRSLAISRMTVVKSGRHFNYKQVWFCTPIGGNIHAETFWLTLAHAVSHPVHNIRKAATQTKGEGSKSKSSRCQWRLFCPFLLVMTICLNLDGSI